MQRDDTKLPSLVGGRQSLDHPERIHYPASEGSTVAESEASVFITPQRETYSAFSVFYLCVCVCVCVGGTNPNLDCWRGIEQGALPQK